MGYKTFTQPNGITFIAQYWGDEFYYWIETDNGYRIVKGNDAYFYYAILDSRGEFAPSDKKVGIDTPLSSSYKLGRSESRKAEIDSAITVFNQDCELAYQRYQNKRAIGDTIDTLGVILVDFTPSERHRENPQYPNGYEKMLYDSLIFSRYNWVGVPDPEEGELPTPHPEDHELFGSFVDYYWDQSVRTLTFKGKDGLPQIVNPIDPDDPQGILPQWVILPLSKGYYDTVATLSGYFNEAEDSAESQLGVNLSQFEYLAFISAGSMGGGGYGHNLQGYAQPSQNRYNMYEVSLYIPPYFFSHIGSHAHEFGHLLGLNHLYERSSLWNLMGFSSMGPNYEGACPSSTRPYQRGIKLGWVPIDTLSFDTTITIHYDYGNPKYYLVKSPNNSQYFFLESRLREGFDLWTPHDPDFVSTDPISIDPNGNIGGLLIWEKGNYGHIIPADNTWEPDPTHNFPETTEEMLDLSRDPFPFDQQDGAGSGINFNDYTSPNTKQSNGSYSYIAINNITWNSNDSSITVDILFNYDLPPATPQNLTVSWISGNLYLEWVSINEPDMDHYNVWVKYTNFSNPGFWHKVSSPDQNDWTDTNVQQGGRPPDFIYYKVTAEDIAGNVSDYSNTVMKKGDVIIWPMYRAVGIAQLPERYELQGNSPNPFNPITEIKYALPEPSNVRLTIYNLLGKEIKTLVDDNIEIGFKQIVWNGVDQLGKPVSSGMYIYKMTARSLESNKQFTESRKMVLLR